jgi:hypothetical protein
MAKPKVDAVAWLRELEAGFGWMVGMMGPPTTIIGCDSANMSDVEHACVISWRLAIAEWQFQQLLDAANEARDSRPHTAMVEYDLAQLWPSRRGEKK